MQRWKNILFNIVLCFNCLLLVFVLAENKIHVPAWLQVAGRMHPLILHFPIVLLVLYILWSMFLQARAVRPNTGPEDEIGKWLLLASALTASLTALMGFLLSKEEGYNTPAVWWHKWGGVAISLFSFFWYAFRNTIHARKYMPQLASVISFALIIFTGHQGANITHGENYLLAPVTHEKLKQRVPLADAVVYADMVQPILETKCMSCHSSQKAKGQLVMETEALLLKGGKHGVLWSPGHPELSLLLERIHLPEADKKHMPPIGKPQLDDQEIEILYQWIKSGAGFKQKVADLAPADSLRLLANSIFSRTADEVYDFSAASDRDIEKLNNTNRLVHPVALSSPALAASFYNRQNYTAASLKDLQTVKTQLVELDLAYMPLKEEDIKTIAQFQNLRKLNLNFTGVQGKDLLVLNKLLLLKQISLAGTAVNEQDIKAVAGFPAINAIYLWNTPISDQQMTNLRKSITRVLLETGPDTDTITLKLNAPVLETEERIVKGSGPLWLKMKHYIKGANIRYSLDGSLPDSVNSLLYKDSLQLNKKAVLKARAFKPGWFGSDSIAVTFYQETFIPDSIRSLTKLDSVYKGKNGAKTLINAVKGGANLRSGDWLGFRRNKMDVVMFYNKPVTINSVSVSTYIDIGGYIMPAASIELWGGSSEKNLTKLGNITPQQPDSIKGGGMMKGFDFNLKPTTVSCLRIVAVPVAKLPKWHPGKGQQGWVFVDEIFVN